MQNLLETALTLIAQYNYVFYGLGVLGLLFYLNRARTAYRQMRMTPFPIEREEASANARDAVMIAVIFGAILGATFYIDRILLAPPGEIADIQSPIASNGGIGSNDEPTDNGSTDGTVPVLLPSPTATSPAIGPTPEQSPTATNPPDPTSTPESAPPTPPEVALPTATPEPTQAIVATEVIPETATPVPTPIPTQPPQPTAPPVPAASCPTPGVQISSPGNGSVVSGTFNINGTADIPDFQFYKVEYSQGTSLNGFASIGDIIAAKVQGGRLNAWNTAGFPKGVYAVRLTVVDVSGNFPPPCTIYVIVQ